MKLFSLWNIVLIGILVSILTSHVYSQENDDTEPINNEEQPTDEQESNADLNNENEDNVEVEETTPLPSEQDESSVEETTSAALNEDDLNNQENESNRDGDETQQDNEDESSSNSDISENFTDYGATIEDKVPDDQSVVSDGNLENDVTNPDKAETTQQDEEEENTTESTNEQQDESSDNDENESTTVEVITVSNNFDQDEETTTSPDGASDESSGDASVTFDDNTSSDDNESATTTEAAEIETTTEQIKTEEEETTETTQPAEPEPTELEITFVPNVETINIEPNSAFEITCRARGPFNNLQTMIYKDQKPLEQSETNEVTVRIQSASRSDAGQYLCYGFPSDRSTYVAKTITVVIGQSDESVPSSGNIIANEGSNIELSCRPDSDEYRWSKLNGRLSDYARETQGKLMIYYVKYEDSGTYECRLPDGRSDQVVLRVIGQNENNQPDYQSYNYAVRANLGKTSINFRLGEVIEQECTGQTNGESLEIEWYDQSGRLINNDNRYSVYTDLVQESPLSKMSKLTIRNSNRNTAGIYECRVIVGNQKEVVKFELTALESENNERPTFTKACDVLEATCKNGQCIPRSGLCDGKRDCQDGSDELFCGGGCEPNEKQCRNQKCVQKIWWCDGENDCGDNSDEDQCPPKRPGDLCKTHEYMCRDQRQCILKGFVCDGEYDCSDQSDEIGCEPPRIIRGPIRNLTIVLGETIRMECEAAGFPAPYINWRLNWGHVCDEPRCFSTNENGKGVLTITDARLADAGAYSCEALNSKGRVFAIPDAIVNVIVQNRPICNCFNHADECDDNGICLNCRHFTTGRNCERCIVGYEGNPRFGTPNDCKPIRQEVVQICDPDGSYTRFPPCRCKPSFTGQYCNQCPSKHYFLKRKDGKKSSCALCFCNGLQVDCQSSNLNYNRIESKFDEQVNTDGWTVSNKQVTIKTDVRLVENTIEFTQFEEFRNDDLYYFAPAKFLGNKLASYGGNLSFVINYEASSDSKPERLEVRISGARVNIVYIHKKLLYPYQEYTITIPLFEDEFKRFGDGGRVDREHLLMALSNIDLIMIKAKFVEEQHSVKLSDISLDFGEQYPADQNEVRKAHAVELCSCPIGYLGTSCETCAPGYRRSSGGFYLGLCERSDEEEDDFSTTTRKSVVISFDVPNENLVLQPGQNHIVYVTVIGSSDRVVWVKQPEGYLPSGVIQQNNNLVITDARPEISGTYICYLYTPLGEVQKILVINVPTGRQPPSIYSPNQRVSTVSVGEPFSLECVAIGNPLPTIRIETPNQRLAPARLTDPSGRDERKARVEVSFFTEDNAGEYTCIAENEYGERAYETFRVDLIRSGQPPFIRIEPKTIEAYEGSSLTINYTFTGTEPVQIKVQLYNSNQPVSNLFVNKDMRKIEIRRISKDMDGQFIIEATNAYGSVQDYFILRVLDTPGPRIVLSDTVVRIDSGTILKIEPRVQYSGQPYFTWTKDNGQLPSNAQVFGSILYVPSVTKDNEGIYTLTLVDQYGTAKIQVTVFVDETATTTRDPKLPKRIIVRQDQDVELESGKNANIICQLRPRNYKAISTTSWFRGNRAQREKFPSNIRPNQEVLKIIRVKESDAGQYTCTVSSSDGSYQTIVINLIVKDTEEIPPQVEIPEKQKYAFVGDNLELNCRVTGHPEPVVQWLFNNDPINSLSNVFPRGSDLVINRATEQLNGYFTCKAIGQDGQIAQDSVYLQVTPKQDQQQDDEDGESEQQPAPSIQISPSSVNAQVGEVARLTCYVSAQNDDQRFEWTRQDGTLPDGSDVNENTGVLTLYDLKEQDSGIYICQVDNNRALATVNVGPSRPEIQQSNEPLKVEVQPKEINLVQGRDAQFNCQAVGGSNIELQWKKIGDSLDNTRHVIQGSNLLIKNVQPNDRGYFECQAKNSNDETAVDYVRVEVESREAPQVEIYPNQNTIELDYGGSAYLQCRATAGIPPPTISWKRTDGRPLSNKISISQEGSLLEINSASRDEFAEYECVVKNDEGEAKDSISVVARGLPPTNEQEEQQPSNNNNDNVSDKELVPQLVYSQQPINAKEGESVRLACRSVNDEQVRYMWITPKGEYLSAEPDGSLRLEQVSTTESGIYTCSASNRYGTSTGSVRLIVNVLDNNIEESGEDSNQRPVEELKVRIEPKSSTVELGGRVEFTCNILSRNDDDPSTTLKWSRYLGSSLPRYHSINGNSLIIHRVEENDGGNYLCTAQTKDGRISFDGSYLQISRTDPSSAFPVYIKVLESPTDTYQPVVTYRFGVKMSAECVAQSSDIEEITWSKVAGEGAANNRFRFEQTSENSKTLVLDTFLPMDIGTYVCIATRSDGSRAQNSITFSRYGDFGNQFTFEVEGPSQPVNQRPNIEANNDRSEYGNENNNNNNNNNEQQEQEPTAQIEGEKRLVLNENDFVELNCRITNVAEAEWEKHGGELGRNVRIDQNGEISSLKIYNIQQSDSGYYICNVRNSAGSTRDYVMVEVNQASNVNDDYKEFREEVKSTTTAPTGTLNDNQQKNHKPLVQLRAIRNGRPIRDGEELRLGCSVTDPDAQVSFSRADGQYADRYSLESNSERTLYELVFSSFEKEFTGEYRCFARNEHGETETSIVIEHEADDSYSVSLSNSDQSEVESSNPQVTISIARGSLEQGNVVELNCALNDNNGVTPNYYTWARYPNLPKSSQIEENRLLITQFDAKSDNGLYTCRASTNDRDYQNSKLIASNDYLLGDNPYFSFGKTSEDDSVVVKCRPGLDAAAAYEWRGPSNSDLDYKIDGEELHLFRSSISDSDQSSTFSCVLKSDSELGSTILDLDVNRDLFERAFEKYHSNEENENNDREEASKSNEENNVEINDLKSDLQDGGIANYECRPEFNAKSIEWKRQDGQSMHSNVDLTRRGYLIINDLSEDNLGIYECHVRTMYGELIKKRINLNFVNRIDHHNYNEIQNRLPPSVRIVPIHMDVREGGRIELECESDDSFHVKNEKYIWQKRSSADPNRSINRLGSTSSILEINYLKQDDTGIYECLLITEYGQANAYFELNVPNRNHISNHERSHYKLDKFMIHNPPPIVTNHNLTKNSIKFNFIEYDLRPFGQIVIMCETDLPQAINNWIKIDKIKKSNAILDGDRLVIYKLNKYDLNNFACESREGTRRVERPLELDADEYYRQMDSFYYYTRNLNIILVNEKSDLRVGGKIVLKCTDELSYEKKNWLLNNLDRSRVFILDDDSIEINPLNSHDSKMNISCLFIDEYGQKKLDYLIDPKYLVELTTKKFIHKPIATSKKNKFIKINEYTKTLNLTTTTREISITSQSIHQIKDFVFDDSFNDTDKLQPNDLNIKFNLIQPNHNQDIRINERVIIDCIASDSSAVITWSNINGDLDDYHVYTDYSRLIINNLNSNSLSTFKCTATINNSKRTRLLNFVNSNEGFRLNIEPQIELINNPNEIMIGSSLSLQCDTNGDKTNKIKWSMPNDYESYRSYIIKDNVLKLNKLSKSHFGRYECSFVRDNIRHLAFFYLTEDILTKFDAEIIVNGGKFDGYLELKCQSNSPNAIYEWSKFHGNFDQTNARINKNIIRFEPFETKDIDAYTCLSRDDLGNEIRTSVGLNYDFDHMFIVKDHKKKRMPKIIEIYQNGNLELGDSFELDCLSDMENSNVEWYLKGKKFNQTNYEHRSSKLVFYRLMYKDEGIYECVASNEYGSDMKSVEIKLRVPSTTAPLTTKIISTTNLITLNDEINENNYQPKNKHTIRIQVLSDPIRDHVDNGVVKLKCLSDFQNVIYEWVKLNDTTSKNAKMENDILTLEPFNKENAGVYRCKAINLDTNQELTKRININIDARPKPLIDLSDKLKIELLSKSSELTKGGTIKLKCTIDYPNVGVIWTKRGSKFSSRAFGSPTKTLNTAIITINNFQKEDLGIYVCKVKPLDPVKLKYTVKGELVYYLMARDLGFDESDELVLGPEIDIKLNCNQKNNECIEPIKYGDSVMLNCNINNLESKHNDLELQKLEWKRVDEKEFDHDSYQIQRPNHNQISLNIHDLAHSHVGEYACYAYASIGTIRQTVNIKFLDDQFFVNINKPTKRINLAIEKRKQNFDQDQLLHNELVLGKSYVFDCITDSIWPVKWRRLHKRNDYNHEEDSDNDMSHNSGYIVKKSTISFRSLNNEDYGEYVCVSSNLFGKSGVKLVINENGFDIKQLTFIPHQSTNNHNKKKYLMNKNARMKAKLMAARQSHDLDWSKVNSQFSRRVKIAGNKLLIDPYRQAYDKGEYVCSTQLNNASIYLNENSYDFKQENLLIKISKLPYLGKTNRKIELVCDSLKYKNNINYKIQWQRKDTNKFLPNIFIKKNKLIINDFDKKDFGIYECKLYNKNNIIEATASLDLRLTNELFNKYFRSNEKPNIKIVVLNQDKVKYDSSVKLACKLMFDDESVRKNRFHETYSIEWIRNNLNMSHKAYLLENYLIMNKFDLDDLGSYTCRVSNNAGSSMSTIEFYDEFGDVSYKIIDSNNNTVTYSNKDDNKYVKSKNRFKTLVGSINFLSLDEDIAIECLNLYGHRMKPYWIKLNSSSKVIYQNFSQILSIRKFSKADLGTYICRTTNKDGNLIGVGFNFDLHDNKYVIVTELDEYQIGSTKDDLEDSIDDIKEMNAKETLKNNLLPNIKVTFSDRLAMSKGERVEIKCLTDVNAKVEWYKVDKNNTLIPLVSSNRESILITPITSKDLGRYRCKAVNHHGFRHRDAILTKNIENNIDIFIFGFVNDIDDKSNFYFYNSDFYNSIKMPKNENVGLDKNVKYKIEPTLLNVKKIGKLRLNSSIDLKCYSNDPNINPIWSKSLRTTDNLDITIHNDLLSIKKLNRKSTQLYECSALNKEKNIITRLLYSIDILNKKLSPRKIRKYVKSRIKSYLIEPMIDTLSTFPPIRLDFISKIENVTRNSTIKIKCSTLDEGWVVEWQRDGIILNSKFNKNILIINGIDRNNLLFKCVAKNSLNVNQIGIRFKQNKDNRNLYEGFLELENENIDKTDQSKSVNRENEIKIIAPNYNYDDEDENIDYYDQKIISLYSTSQKSIRESNFKEPLRSDENFKPSIDLKFINPKTSYINIGERVEIECKTTSTLKFNQNWIKNDEKFSPRVKFQQNDELLIIESFEDDDIGLYSCLVNDYETKQNLNIISFKIQPIQFDLFSINIMNSYLTPTIELNYVESLFWLNRENYNIHVACVSSFSSSPIWKRPIHINFLNNTKIIGNILRIDHVNKQNIDSYVCSASNKYGTSYLTYQLDFDSYYNEFQFYLARYQSKTNNENNFKYDNKLFHYSTDLLLSELNSNVLLQCPIRNSNIKWFKSDNFLNYTFPNTNSGDLFIKNLTSNDYGKYTCEYNDYKHSINVEKLDKIPYLNEENSSISFNLSNFLDMKNNFKIEISFQILKVSTSNENILFFMSNSDGKYYLKLFVLNSTLIFKSNLFLDSTELLMNANYDKIEINQWYYVKLSYKQNEWDLYLNSLSNYRAFSSELVLSLTNRILYLGKSIGNKSFNGAFSSLSINDIKFDLIHDSLDLQSIKYLNACQNVECKNNGYCLISQNIKGFKCSCKKSYYGEYCQNVKQCFHEKCNDNEISESLCERKKPCYNNGKCVDLNENSHKCMCLIGTIGEDCSKKIKIKNSIALNGDGYIELSNKLFSINSNNLQEFSISFVSFKSTCVLLTKSEVETKDFFELKLEDGYLIYRHRINDKDLVIKTSHTLINTKIHIVSVHRINNKVKMIVDNIYELNGTHEKLNIDLNGKSNYFLGGYPLAINKNNFLGYIYSLAFKNESNNKYVMYNFGEKFTISGYNVDKPLNH